MVSDNRSRTVTSQVNRRKARDGGSYFLFGLLCAAAGAIGAGPAHAQRADENAVRAAEDAFGLSVGNERLGLYTEDNVRGFSPSLSGNIRLDGLYYDRRGTLSARLVRGSSIRVGITAQGYDFPAPSGIVDYTLRKPGPRRIVSVGLDTDSWGRVGAELDADLPLSETVSLGLGGSRVIEGRGYGADRDILSGSIRLAWRPNDRVEVVPFASIGRSHNEETQPLIIMTTPALPAAIPRRMLLGQDWSDWRSSAQNHGVLGRVDLGDGWLVRGGLFYSRHDRDFSYSDLQIMANPQGPTLRTITAFPHQTYSAYSGELRVVKTFLENERRHSLLLSLRGRDRTTIYGGGDTESFGAQPYAERVVLTEPAFNRLPANHETVLQKTLGLGYQGVWPRVGELNFGMQSTRYQRSLRFPSGLTSGSTDEPILWNINSAVYARPWLTVFGGYTRGLEDGGFAPENALNANAALPATRTRQADLGVRVAAGNTRLVAAVFSITKPYYGLDSANVYAPIASTKSKGLEVSLISTPIKGLRLVTGLVLTRPRVEGLSGPGQADLKPLGAIEEIGRISVDFSPPSAPAWSFDAALAYTGDRVARVDNRLTIPDRAILDLGVRYRFKIHDRRAVARVAVFNATDKFGWQVTSGGGFLYEDPRRVLVSLVADF